MAAKQNATDVVKKRKTVNNDHYTLVVARGPLGLFKHVRLVANYKQGIEEIVMVTQRYTRIEDAERSALTLAKNLNIRVVVE